MTKQFMQTVVFRSFEEALRDFTIFLLGFILRDAKIRRSRTIEKVVYNPWIRLKLSAPKGPEVNDVDLIPLRHSAMIRVQSQIEEFQKPNSLVVRHKIVTTPKLETINKDLFSVIHNMHDALHKIDRVEALIFPLLRLANQNLAIPDVTNNENLSHYVQLIEKLIAVSLKSTKAKLADMSKFMSIFRKKVGGIIFDLKKTSFNLYQEQQQAEELAQLKRERDEESQQEEEQAEKQPEAGADQEEDDDFASEEEPLDDLAEEGRDTDMAYKSVEIDHDVMKKELTKLRSIIWQVQETVENSYDFGLVDLDCTVYKKKLLSHCQDLIDTLENHIRSDFLTKMNIIKAEVVVVKGKLDMDAESIDDVIMLLDYIEALKTHDTKISEIQVQIEDLNVKMVAIENLEVVFRDNLYTEFLHMRFWPQTFRKYIETRKLELMSKKDNLFNEMNDDIEGILL
jgi:hypothetical protein